MIKFVIGKWYFGFSSSWDIRIASIPPIWDYIRIALMDEIDAIAFEYMTYK